ncbi:MAG: hypothetical protein JO288_14880 [Hyphomicrobiales bacterium]|nr:hypothetical protein [Hyphomicrobiales bacterium]
MGPRLRLAEQGRGGPSSPSPEEGRRLVVAFMSIKNAAVRDAIITLIERMSRVYKDPG